MRIFLAGASGVIGSRIIPLLTSTGHVVAGMTRSPDKVQRIEDLGAEPVVCDVYDASALRQAVSAFGPDLVIHQLTDLPDDAAQLPDTRHANVRMRREGTRNLIDAARAAGAGRFMAQSIAWDVGGEGTAAKAYLEETVLAYPGLVLRYGQFYGPGTYHAAEPPEPPRIHIDDAARRTVELLDAPSGVVEIVET